MMNSTTTIDTAAETKALVALFAEAKALEARAKKMIDDAKARAVALRTLTGDSVFAGPEGAVIISEVAGAARFDRAIAEAFLTPEQRDACIVVGAPTTRIEFKAAKR